MKRLIRITFATAALALATAGASAMEPRTGVRLRALDKITGNAADLVARTGETIKFGRLSLTVRACYQAPPEDTPESAAFLEIRQAAPANTEFEVKSHGRPGAPPPDPAAPIFSGWMFASSPGLSALEHPIYDVWVISCTATAPSTP